MANDPIGNNILEGPLGVCRIILDGVDLGKTMGDTELIPEEDNKDIMYDQNGTKPQDKIPTGMSYTLNCTFAEIDKALVEKVLRGTTGSGRSTKFGLDIYGSRKENSKTLKIVRVDSEGVASTDEYMEINCYKASPEVTSGFVYGADVQRTLGVSFYIFYDEDEKAFFYFGDASSVGLTPIA